MKAAGLALMPLLVFGLGATSVEAQSTYQITSATNSTTGLAVVPAGIGGVTLNLTGTLPTAAQVAASGLTACFYTGYGSTTGITPGAPNGSNTEPLTVPASTIQSIPTTQFTAANGYSVTALVYFIASGACDGTFDATFTNQYPVQVLAPSLGSYSGPTNIPQTNPATNLQAGPLSLNIPAAGFLPSSTTGGATTVMFGSTSVTLAIPATATSSINVPVPAAFASSAAGTQASLQICNTFTGATAVCTTPTPAITLTVTALAASAGTLTAAPTPVLTSGTTVLTAQFTKGANAGTASNLGAPSGAVSFTATGATVAPAPLILDTTATFVSQTTAVTTPATPTPIITPAAGSYSSGQTITITDAIPGSAIYYTQDGSTPTTSSALYTGPFTITTSQTVSAIAAGPGLLSSAVASAAYIVRPATQLAFQVQASNTPLNTAITPAVQVAVEDSTGAVVTSSTAPVTVALYSDPNSGVLSGTLTVNAVNGIATFPDLKIDTLGTGYTLRASSGTLTAIIGNAFNIVPPSITLTPQSTLIGINSTLNGTFTLSAPAPTGGLTVTLTSGTPANVTIAPATVTVAAGGTGGSFTYTGVAAGNSTLSASAPSYQTGTALTTATSAQVSLGLIPSVAPGQTQSLALSLATAAPAGGTTVTFTIANTNIATVTQSVFVPAGQFTASTNPQVAGVLIGTTTVTANAPGYAPATRTVTVTVTANFSPGTTQINLITSTNTVLMINAPAPAGGIKFNLSSDDTTKVTVPTSVTVIQGGTTVKVPITGVADGTTTIRATSPGITEADGTVTVNSSIASNSYITGYDLEYGIALYLPVAPSTPTTVTVTSNDPSTVLISASNTTVGQTTLTFPNTTSSYIGTIYVQGKKVGGTTLTISAPGYTSGTETITVDNTGFVYYGQPNFTTTTYSNPNTSTIYPVPLNANLSVYGFFSWAINPGSANISVPVTSSATNIGTVSSPVVFKALDTSESFTFTPVAAGNSNLTIGTPPAGFSVSTQYQQIVATVNTPAIVANGTTTGVHLQTGISVYLPVAPPSGVTVTVSVAPSSGSVIASLSKSNTVAGTATQTFTGVTGTYVGTLYVQGQLQGTATLTVSAPGYVSGTANIVVNPSGFAYYGTPNINTTSFSAASQVNVYPVVLNTNLSPQGYFSYTLNPGVGPVTVPITDSATSVGTISANSVVFNTNDSGQSFNFQPVAAGTTNLTLGTPTGFSTPTTYTQISATVTAPAISVGGGTTGVHFQGGISIYLPVAPPSATTVTVTTSAPLVATIAPDNVTTGKTTLTFTNVTSTYVGTIYVQGQTAGTSTLTVAAPGYTSGTSTLTIQPSGFAFYGNSATFTTTTFSSANQLTVYPVILDPSSLAVTNYGYALSPGVGPVTVTLTDSATSVGTISANTLTFNTNDTSQSFTFKPVSAGTANIAIGATPTGFSTPTNYTSGVATVTAPAISVNDSYTGLNLETTLGIYLPQTPPNPVTVTVTSNGPLIGVLSKNGTTVGTNTLTFTNVTSTSVGTIYVQGASVGATTLKVSAPGYIDGNANIYVYASGFAFYGNPSFTTTAGSSPYQIGVYPVMLNAGTLTVYTYNGQYVGPSAGTVNVPATSSNTTAGTVASPLVFAPGTSSVNLFFTPLATGSSTLSLQTPTGFSTPSQYEAATATVQ